MHEGTVSALVIHHQIEGGVVPDGDWIAWRVVRYSG